MYFQPEDLGLGHWNCWLLLATAPLSGVVVAAAGTGATEIGGIGDVATEATDTDDLARSSEPQFAISSAKKINVTILSVALQD